MIGNGWLQIAIFGAIVVAITKPFGFYMTRVFSANGRPYPRCCDRSSGSSIAAAASRRAKNSPGACMPYPWCCSAPPAVGSRIT